MNTQQRKFLAIATVVGLHAVVIIFMLAFHGCKSDAAKTAPTALAPAPAPAGSPVADNEKGFYSPTTPPPEPVRPVAPVIVPEPTPQPVAQYTETLRPPASLGSTPPPDSAPMSVMYEVAAGDSLSTIARKNGITIKELVDANAPKITVSTILQPKMQLKIPARPAAATAPMTAAGDEHLYKVAAGDSLAKLANANHTTIKALQEANAMGTSTAIRQGQMLKLPAATAATGASTPTTAGTDAGEGTYTVVPGDTLGKIAGKVGVTLKELYGSSGLNDTTAKNIKPGQKIKLPASAHAPAGTAPAGSTDSSPTTILNPTTSPTVTAVRADAATNSPPVTAIKP